MLKKLTEEKLSEILEAGIAEFAEQGAERACMSRIAKSAGISVGVLYKYYADKDAFFDACLSRSLDVLRSTLGEIAAEDGRIMSGAEAAIRAVQNFSAEHVNYTRMYLRITAESGGEYAAKLAGAIEGLSSEVYARRIAEAQSAGDVRADMDPRLFAFFFDSLLMMMQFSYCCDYYRERFRVYCGEAAENDALVASQLLKFLESAFTTEKKDIPHRPKNTKGEG